MTPAAIRKATDAELEARVKEFFTGAEERGGLTRKQWNEYHRIYAEQMDRKRLTGHEAKRREIYARALTERGEL